MANITGTWSYGKFVAYTDSGPSDDTETWSYGKVRSVLEYVLIAIGGTKGKLLLLGVGK